MAEVTTVNYLIPTFRLRIGDLDATAYRYLDEWLVTALLLSVKTLQRYWNFKYLVNTLNQVYRNTQSTFLSTEPPVIENTDEDTIILMAMIILLEGSLENSAWNAVSWRDAEISYSNLEQFRSRSALLKSLWDELNSKILPPTKRLVWPSKQHLPGYINNEYERSKETA